MLEQTSQRCEVDLIVCSTISHTTSARFASRRFSCCTVPNGAAATYCNVCRDIDLMRLLQKVLNLFRSGSGRREAMGNQDAGDVTPADQQPDEPTGFACVGSRYLLTAVLGEGGNGCVYRAIDTLSRANQEVAVKCSCPGVPASVEALQVLINCAAQNRHCMSRDFCCWARQDSIHDLRHLVLLPLLWPEVCCVNVHGDTHTHQHRHVSCCGLRCSIMITIGRCVG